MCSEPVGDGAKRTRTLMFVESRDRKLGSDDGHHAPGTAGARAAAAPAREARWASGRRGRRRWPRLARRRRCPRARRARYLRTPPDRAAVDRAGVAVAIALTLADVEPGAVGRPGPWHARQGLQQRARQRG